MTITVGMPSKATAARAAAKGATKVVRSRTARRAAKPPGKATWLVGRKVTKRKAKQHSRRYGETTRAVGSAARTAGSAARTAGSAARTAGSAARIYAPMVAEVLGMVEQPKPRRRFPAFLAGGAVGAGLMYLAGRDRTA